MLNSSEERLKELRKNLGEEVWKMECIEYIINIEKFLDIVDNIQDKDLKNRIIYQHFHVERIIKNFFKNKME